MSLENEPLNQVLQCMPLRVEHEEVKEVERVHVNINMTPMGRPVNLHPQVRWKPLEPIKNDNESEILEEEKNKELLLKFSFVYTNLFNQCLFN